MKTQITLSDIMTYGPCHTKEKCAKLMRGKSYSLEEFLDLDHITIEDRLWVVLREEYIDANSLHEFGCWCAESVLHLLEDKYPDDKRPRKAIEAKRKWLRGEISDVELTAAGTAAWTAAGTAAWTARAAAWAAGTDARAAARAAGTDARAAARAAETDARAAAWAAGTDARAAARAAETDARAAAGTAAWTAAEHARDAWDAACDAACDAQLAELKRLITQ